MNKVSELDSEFTFDCYFRQTWRDPRLSFKIGPKTIIVNFRMLDKIWKPYTYFANSNSAYVGSKIRFFLSYQNFLNSYCKLKT